MGKYNIPNPVLDSKEVNSLNSFTETYEKLTEPGAVHKVVKATGKLIPDNIKESLSALGLNITQQELYSQIMKVISSGFKVLEETITCISLKKVCLDTFF